jgi:hypothetical protein
MKTDRPYFHEVDTEELVSLVAKMVYLRFAKHRNRRIISGALTPLKTH